MNTKISIKSANDIDATNAYSVTVTRPNETPETMTVHTSPRGNGLWIDGKQVLGHSQFTAGKNPSAAIRRYFERIENGQ